MSDEKPNKNLWLWDHVQKTNPNDTREVRLGARRFTTIDAYSRIKRATEVFGPVGDGWGWKIMGIHQLDKTVAVHIRLFWWQPDGMGPAGKTGAINEFDTIGQCELFEGKPDNRRLNEEATKIATTDAITKGLSYLGFSADVFMGMYDDDKYVQRLQKEFANSENDPIPRNEPTTPEPNLAADTQKCDDWIAELQGIAGKDKLDEFKKRILEEWRVINARNPSQAQRVKKILDAAYEREEKKSGKA